MTTHHIEDLLSFPCDYMFKAFGPNDGTFPDAVREAAAAVIPVPLDALRVRLSAQSSYVCVTIVAHLQSLEQMGSVYRALQRVDGLRYLL